VLKHFESLAICGAFLLHLTTLIGIAQ